MSARPGPASATDMCTNCREVGKPCLGDCVPCLKWRLEIVEAQIRSLQMGAPRGIPTIVVVPAPGDQCGGTGTKTFSGEPCPGCRACA